MSNLDKVNAKSIEVNLSLLCQSLKKKISLVKELKHGVSIEMINLSYL